MRRLSFAALALAGAMSLTACAESATGLDPQLQSLEVSASRAPAPTGSSITALAGATPSLSVLVDALVYVDAELQTGLVDLFASRDGQFTVFAPTNAAFANLLDQLDKVANLKFTKIEQVPPAIVLAVLQYHVATGRRAANSVVPRNGTRTIETLRGETFAVRSNGTIADGLTGLRPDAKITGPNISASNGIVHLIDQVIVPPSIVAALTAN